MQNSRIRTSLYATAMMFGLAAIPFGQVMAHDNAGSAQKASDNQTVPDKAADAWITTKVTSEFATTKGVSATDISVSTSDGVVTLRGTVSSAAEKATAERVAKDVKGVKSVDASGLSVSTAQQ